MSLAPVADDRRDDPDGERGEHDEQAGDRADVHDVLDEQLHADEAEVRQLVIARNERRERAGKAPLDVESEVQRQLRELTG